VIWRLVPLSVALLLATPALAEDVDLNQTLADLGSQVGDKERMDRLGATKVELNQVRGWLTDATNAVKENAAKKARRLFDLVRSQIRLVDQLIVASQVEDEATRVEREIERTRQDLARLKGQLEDKQTQIRALKMRESDSAGEGKR
jgi:chromosome segregation ATPase